MSMTTAGKPKMLATKSPKLQTDQATDLQRRRSGASIAAMMKSTGWLIHTVRPFLTGSLKVQGLTVSNDVDDKAVRLYRLGASVK